MSLYDRNRGNVPQWMSHFHHYKQQTHSHELCLCQWCRFDCHIDVTKHQRIKIKLGRNIDRHWMEPAARIYGRTQTSSYACDYSDWNELLGWNNWCLFPRIPYGVNHRPRGKILWQSSLSPKNGLSSVVVVVVTILVVNKVVETVVLVEIKSRIDELNSTQ